MKNRNSLLCVCVFVCSPAVHFQLLLHVIWSQCSSILQRYIDSNPEKCRRKYFKTFTETTLFKSEWTLLFLHTDLQNSEHTHAHTPQNQTVSILYGLHVSPESSSDKHHVLMCVFSCVSSDVTVLLPQTSYLNHISYMCVFRLVFRVKLFPQTSQPNGFSSVWILLCVFKANISLNPHVFFHPELYHV